MAIERCLNCAGQTATWFGAANPSPDQLEAFLPLGLSIGPSAPELHSLRWETLRHLQGDSSLLTSEHILFSRYLNRLN